MGRPTAIFSWPGAYLYSKRGWRYGADIPSGAGEANLPPDRGPGGAGHGASQPRPGPLPGYALGKGGRIDLGTLLPGGGLPPAVPDPFPGPTPPPGVLAGHRGTGRADLRLLRPSGERSAQRVEESHPPGATLPPRCPPGPGGGGGGALRPFPAGGRGLLPGLSLGAPAALPAGAGLLSGPGEGLWRAALCGLSLYPGGAAGGGGGVRGNRPLAIGPNLG